MLSFLFNLINPLSRILDTIDKRADSETEREKARLAALEAFAREQTATTNGPGRWLMLFFIAPLGVWFAAVCIYSVLWCQGCIYPQPWTVAALPKPIDEWAGAIIATLFAGGFAVRAVDRWRR